MNGQSVAVDHRPLSGTARDQFVGDAVTATAVTWLGARLAMTLAAERAARSPGGARG
jgi:hypothetical protein